MAEPDSQVVRWPADARGRRAIGAIVGGVIGLIGAWAMLATGAISLEIMWFGKKSGEIDHGAFVLAATASAVVAGFLLAELVPRWPATATVAMPPSIVTGVYVAGTMAVLAAGARGEGAIFVIVVGELAAILLPITMPGVLLILTIEGLLWTILTRWVVTGLRVPRTRTQTECDLIVAGAIAASAWVPALLILVYVILN